MTAIRAVLRWNHSHDRPDLEVRVVSARGRYAACPMPPTSARGGTVASGSQGNPMQFARALLFIAAAAALPVHAQSVSPAWDAYRAGQQSDKAAPVTQTGDHVVRTESTAAAQPAALPVVDTAARAAPATQPIYAASTEAAPRGAFFVAAQAGQAWIIDDVRQDARAISAGYRWQAGPVVQVGIEGVAGRIDGTTDRGYRLGDTDYASLGANARFQFGQGPMFAMARLGYWHADAGDDDTVDGAYAGFGLGVDFNRHVNLTLAYTLHAYASSYCYSSRWSTSCGTEVNRADLVTLGLEARF